MNEFIGWHKKRAEARYKGHNERALARFTPQTPIFNRRNWREYDKLRITGRFIS
jgi:hypothetical protein